MLFNPLALYMIVYTRSSQGLNAGTRAIIYIYQFVSAVFLDIGYSRRSVPCANVPVHELQHQVCELFVQLAKSCPVRELAPTDELASELEIRLTNLNVAG